MVSEAQPWAVSGLLGVSSLINSENFIISDMSICVGKAWLGLVHQGLAMVCLLVLVCVCFFKPVMLQHTCNSHMLQTLQHPHVR